MVDIHHKMMYNLITKYTKGVKNMKTQNKKAHQALKMEILVCDETDVVRTSGGVVLSDFSVEDKSLTKFADEKFTQTWY